MWRKLAAAAVIGLLATPALADEQIEPLAQSGSWIAAAHRASITAPPDACVASNLDSGLTFHADESGIDVRFSNADWSLPAHVDGSITLAVGAVRQTVTITGNDDHMVDAEIERDAVVTLFDAMDKAAGIAVTVGSARPVTISLAGSTRVTNAFRTCVGLSGSRAAPGSNPFQ